MIPAIILLWWAADAVRLQQDNAHYTLDNGIVRAAIQKNSGNLASLQFGGLELAHPPGGYWNIVPAGLRPGTSRWSAERSHGVIVNDGESAEIAVRFQYAGEPAAAPLDVELHYAVRRGDPGVYSWAVLEHRPEHPPLTLSLGRFCMKLNAEVFDFLTIDAQRRRQMISGADWVRGEPLNLAEARRMTTGIRKGEVEHKYDYSAMRSATPAYGWSGTKHPAGLWLVNPSIEYLNGGPTKVELTGHIDLKDDPREAVPVLLSVWHGPHYGTAPIRVAAGERWRKTVGPFLLYCNTGDWNDALARAARERAAWPYPWVRDAEYRARGGITGRLLLRDPQSPAATTAGAWVGLAAGDWQTDGKAPQFWTRADEAGNFAIRNATRGTYTLHAFVDGVLGEFSREGITVEPGATRPVGTLEWAPVRRGRQIWEIGKPDRTAAEFRHGDEYWQWGLYRRYPLEFPDDVNFIVGKSDPRRDWNYVHTSRPDGRGGWAPATWRISFDMAGPVRGRATLRLAICGARGGERIRVAVNGRDTGDTGALPDSGVMHRDGIRGYWCEREIGFDAAWLASGGNTIELTSRGGGWVYGVLYDYVRLEIDDAAKR